MPQLNHGARPLPAAAPLWSILLLSVSGLLQFGIPLTLSIADASVDHASLLGLVSIRLRRNPPVFVNGRLRQGASLVAEALHGGSCAALVGWLFLCLYRARAQPGLRLRLRAVGRGLPLQLLAHQVATTAALLVREVWQACVASWRALAVPTRSASTSAPPTHPMRAGGPPAGSWALRPATSTHAAAPRPPLALEQQPPACQRTALAEPLGSQPQPRFSDTAIEAATAAAAPVPLTAVGISPAEAAARLHRHREFPIMEYDVLCELQQQQYSHTAAAPSDAVEPPADPWVTGAEAASAAALATGLPESAAEASDGAAAADRPAWPRPRPLAGYRPFSTRGGGSGPVRLNPALLSLDARLSVAAGHGSHRGDAVHALPPYVPRAQLISTHIKIHGAEPEAISTGYQDRIAEALTLSGLQLDAVYVQKGCIDLRVGASTFGFGFAGGRLEAAAAADPDQRPTKAPSERPPAMRRQWPRPSTCG